MLVELPSDIIKLILYKLDYQSIINLGKTYENITNLLKDPMIWCEFLIEHKDYDDNSFCYKYNNKIICYDKKCIQSYNTYQLNNDFKGIYFFYPSKTFYDLWKLIEQNGYQDDWSMTRIINLAKLNNKNVIPLCQEIENRFRASLNSFELYKQLFSSIQGFYKVLISGKRWKETCRRIVAGPCKEPTMPYSPFCFNCRSNNSTSDLLQNVIDSTGSFSEQNIKAKVKQEEEKLLEVSVYDNERGLYKELRYGLIVKENDDGQIVCIGKLFDDAIIPLLQEDKNIALKLGLIC